MKIFTSAGRYLHLLSGLFLIVGAIQVAKADPVKPLAARLHLTHLASDTWRADYELDEPVENIEFEKVGLYRSQAWRLLTPGLKLVTNGERELITADGKRFSSISIEVALHLSYEQGSYTPFDRFSDGGTDVYLGFFAGNAKDGNQARPLHLSVQLTGLPNENIVPPDAKNPEEPDYAYFGPATPAPFGVAKVILDPQIPAWLIPVIQDTTAKVTSYFDQVWHRKLGATPLILVSLDPAASKGLSIKGGAMENKIVYRFGGDALRHDGSPQVRRYIAELVAHELAHIWQRNVLRGGIGEGEPWVHEGGAEAIAVAVLEKTGLFSKEEVEAYSAKLLAECEQLKGSVDTYRGYYACGFKRYRDYDTDIFALWKKMMELSESSGQVYSGRMIDALLGGRVKDFAGGR
jgi:hypothetical protein